MPITRASRANHANQIVQINAFVTAHLLESSLARFKNVVCCFQTISCLLSFNEGTNGSPRPFVYFLYEREQEVHKCMYSPKTFPSQ